MVLYVNACVRTESRTDRIARALLEKLGKYEEVSLSKEGLKPLDEETLRRIPVFRTIRNFKSCGLKV